jgi:hypothetical protein
VEAKGWADERLAVMMLQALTLHAHADRDKATQVLVDALTIAEPGGFVRSFVDEGIPMAQLLSRAPVRLRMPAYVTRLLAVFDAEKHDDEHGRARHPGQSLVAPLSHRELEVLRLITAGLSNHEIGERLFLALDTVTVAPRHLSAPVASLAVSTTTPGISDNSPMISPAVTEDGPAEPGPRRLDHDDRHAGFVACARSAWAYHSHAPTRSSWSISRSAASR